MIKESLRAMRKAYIPGMTCVGTPYLTRETGDGFENERLVERGREEGAAHRQTITATAFIGLCAVLNLTPDDFIIIEKEGE